MMLRRAIPLALPLVLLCFLSGAADAQGATCNFDGPGNDWHTATNWSCGQVPDNGDDVTMARSTSSASPLMPVPARWRSRAAP